MTIFRNSQNFLFISIALAILCLNSKGVGIDHWESVVLAQDEWRYFIGVNQPETNWRDLDFNAEQWAAGPGGIGYGDDDDRTVIDPCLSLYMRRQFEIVDREAIEMAVFNMDYDDGFVAWLNGVEIARSNVGRVGDIPAFDQTTRTNHEARMYQGGEPNYYVFDKDQVQSLFLDGANILAVQVHNREATSSDMSAIPFLSVGISGEALDYRPTPEWFSPPMNFQSSNLPILLIDTQGQSIENDYRIAARLNVLNKPFPQRNRLDDEPVLECRISIEIRGSSSASFDKKSYNIETQKDNGENLNVPLLGLPDENDWILYGPYSDKSLLRNAVTFSLGRAMGRYASRYKFCELVLNGDYQGLYMLMEKIKRDKNRVDIARLKVEDKEGEEISGGYIIKVDKKEGEYDGWTSYSNPPRSSWKPIFFQYVYPKHDTITAAQKSYIQNYIMDFEKALNKSNFRDPESGYLPYIDTISFVDMLIINELTKDIDGYRFSTFMYKDKNGPLTMGPIWDYNLGFGNVDYGAEGAMETEGWMYNTGGARMYWFPRMMMHRTFKEHLRDRWFELRRGSFSTENVHALIDSLAEHIDEAQRRNFQRWPVLGKYLWPNFYVGQTWQQELDFLTDWIDQRLVWMDANMPYPETSVKVHTEAQESFTVSPNPFNSSMTIKLPDFGEQFVEINVYDILGHRVRTLCNANINSAKSLTWDGRDQNGDDLSSGIYFIDIRGGERKIIKVTLVR